MRADLVVLEWENLGPGPVHRVRDLPAGGERLVADEVEGLQHVMVNGAFTRTAGRADRTVRAGAILTPDGA
jgi:hypothetical protein